ncbi:YitT family protein [Selenomonadales bacterium OttesenSCG-928-I06]|nr:YitT family protein [Selenomonadales bacterium OttesenSCG-928-I06]
MKQKIKKYIVISIGCFILALGINLFLAPNNLLSGGVSGIAMCFYYLYKFPIGVVSIILNIPLFIAAYYFLSKEYVIVALYGLLFFSFSVDLTAFLQNYRVVDDILLAAIYGGIVSGTGSGLIFRFNGSTGGTDIIGSIMKKHYGLNIGMMSFSVNIFIMILAASLFGTKLAMYTLISMFVAGTVVDKVIEGFNRKKNVMIISEFDEKIADAILSEMHRGVTMLNGVGAYTRQDKKVLLVVVTTTQVPKVRLIVEKIDPKAFMIVTTAAEVMGRGFSNSPT